MKDLTVHYTLERSSATLPAVFVRLVTLAIIMLNTLKWRKIRHGQLRPMTLKSAA